MAWVPYYATRTETESTANLKFDCNFDCNFDFDKPGPRSEDHVSGHSLRLYVSESCLSAVFVFVTLVFADMI